MWFRAELQSHVKTILRDKLLTDIFFTAGASQQYNKGSQASVPSTNYGVPVSGPSSFGSGSSFGSSSFGQQGSNFGQSGAASRQYLAPKLSSSNQNIPQQPFDEETGYHY